MATKTHQINITVNKELYNMLVELDKEVDVLCEAITTVYRQGDTHWAAVHESMERLGMVQPTNGELTGISGQLEKLNYSEKPNGWTSEMGFELRKIIVGEQND